MTGHGISAASGKLGAIISQFAFLQLKDVGGKNQSINHLLKLFGLFTFIGYLFTLLIPETKGLSLEELSNENEKSIKTVDDDTSKDYTSKDYTSKDDTSKDDTSKDDTSKDDTSKDDTSKDD